MDSESSVDDNTPLWKYVTKLGKTPGGEEIWKGDAITVVL